MKCELCNEKMKLEATARWRKYIDKKYKCEKCGHVEMYRFIDKNWK